MKTLFLEQTKELPTWGKVLIGLMAVTIVVLSLCLLTALLSGFAQPSNINLG